MSYQHVSQHTCPHSFIKGLLGGWEQIMQSNLVFLIFSCWVKETSLPLDLGFCFSIFMFFKVLKKFLGGGIDDVVDTDAGAAVVPADA
jgi:hypothetical protein